MWSYNARERRPRPDRSSDDGATSYDGKDRTVSRSKNSQEVRRLGETDFPQRPLTNTRNREEQGS